MPYICLATSTIPDGVLQITDLFPNVSQHNNPTYPAGQNRYLRRPGTDSPVVNATTGLVEGAPEVSNQHNFDGLAAYLVDKVEPGSLEQATADITLAVLPNALDRIVINGLVFIEFSAGVNDATTAGTTIDPFIVQIAGTAALTATNIDTVLTDPVAIATMKGLLGATNYVDSTSVDAVTTLDALTGAAAPLLGSDGDFALTLPVVGSEARITLPTLARLARTNELWDATTISTAMTAILARMDAGATDMSLANINTDLATVSADITGAAATSSSVGTLLEFLSVLAGHTYRLPVASQKFTAATAPDAAHVWSATLGGAFTETSTVFDTQMYSGEWGPSGSSTGLSIDGVNIPDAWLKKGTTVVGGDAETPEIGEARATLDSTAFQASVQSGQLAQFAAGVTLFPDAAVQAKVAPFLRSMQDRTATTTGTRVATVYDDDGTLLV